MKKVYCHLQYAWWKYLLVALAISLGWTALFTQFAATKDEEKVAILYMGEQLQYEELQQCLWGNKSDITNQTLKKVTVEKIANAGSYFNGIISTRIYEKDIIILTEDLMHEYVGRNFFEPLPLEKIAWVNSTSLYMEDGKPYGFIVSGGDGSLLGQYIGTQEKVYVFLSSQSVNLDRLYGKGVSGYDAALQMLRFMMEGEAYS